MKTPFIILVASLAAIGNSALAQDAPSQNPFVKPSFFKLDRSLKSQAPVPDTSTLPKVRATLVGGQTPMALVGDAVLDIGKMVNGYQLVAVREGIAVFERDGVSHEVKVRDGKPSGEDNKDQADAYN